MGGGYWVSYWVKEKWQKRFERGHVRVLGWWSTRLWKRGKKEELTDV